MSKHNSYNPNKWLDLPCPCCDGMRRVINGQWLKKLREEAGLDQRKFGKRVKRSGPYISDIERNRRECSSDILEEYIRLM